MFIFENNCSIEFVDIRVKNTVQKFSLRRAMIVEVADQKGRRPWVEKPCIRRFLYTNTPGINKCEFYHQIQIIFKIINHL